MAYQRACDMRDESDYKLAYVLEEQRRQHESKEGWIYIGVDTRDHSIAKIGLTSGLASTRESSSQNPFYTIFCMFKVKAGVAPRVLREIENAAKRLLAQRYRVFRHVGSGRESEWFGVSPATMRIEVRELLAASFMRYMHGYYCYEREIDVIYEWENAALLYGREKGQYRARDLSNPPAAPECMSPLDCGSYCDCWSSWFRRL